MLSLLTCSLLLYQLRSISFIRFQTFYDLYSENPFSQFARALKLRKFILLT